LIDEPVQLHAVLAGGGRGRFPRVVTLVDVSYFHFVAREGLDHFTHVGPVILISRADPQGRQVAQGVDGHMDLVAPAGIPSTVAAMRDAIHHLDSMPRLTTEAHPYYPLVLCK
jgi:hypothetical protein